MASRQLPKTFRKLVISKLSTNFREAVELVTVPMLQPGPDELLVKSRYVGINATDINYSAGRYHRGQSPPFDAGLEEDLNDSTGNLRTSRRYDGLLKLIESK
ncbi:prostaglandin reductase-3-like [Oculina patagonica]